jgi:hypothetical protein
MIPGITFLESRYNILFVIKGCADFRGFLIIYPEGLFEKYYIIMAAGLLKLNQ